MVIKGALWCLRGPGRRGGEPRSRGFAVVSAPWTETKPLLSLLFLLLLLLFFCHAFSSSPLRFHLLYSFSSFSFLIAFSPFSSLFIHSLCSPLLPDQRSHWVHGQTTGGPVELCGTRSFPQCGLLVQPTEWVMGLSSTANRVGYGAI